MTYDANEDCLSVNPINLQPGKKILLSERLAEALTQSQISLSLGTLIK